MPRQFLIALMLFAAATFGANHAHAAAEPRETTVFQEKFDPKLTDGWSWVRELPSAWKLDGGALVLTVQPGYLHPYKPEGHNVLLRAHPENLGNHWAVVVRLDSDPTKQFEHAGVLLYWDDGNYISLFRESLDGKSKLQMVTTKNASPRYAVVDNDAHPVWLRLVVHGDEVTSQFRASEKDSWQTVGKSKVIAPERPRCGVTSGGAAPDSRHEARFSDFQILMLAGK